MPTLLQGSLSGGELSPSLHPRVDLARYQTSVRTGKNFITRPYGGMVNRPGTQYVGGTPSNARTRLIPFQVAVGVAYVLELSNLSMRFIANDAYIESAPNVPLVLVTPYTADMLFEIKYTQSADTMYFAHPDVPPQTLKRNTPTSFTLAPLAARQGPFEDLNTDARYYIYATQPTGNISILSNQPLFTPNHVGAYMYLEPRELTRVKPWSQGERGLVVGDTRRSDGKTYIVTTVPSSGGSDWTETGPWRPVHDTGRAWDGGGMSDLRDNTAQQWNVGIEWEYLDSGYGIALITSYFSSNQVNATVIRRMPDSVVGGASTLMGWPQIGDGVTKVFSIPGAVSTSVGDYTVSYTGGAPIPSEAYTDPSNPTQGWTINATLDTITFNVAPIAFGFAVEELSANRTTDTYAFGAWSKINGYPSEVEFFSDRLIFANTPAQPQTLWMSNVADYTNFGKSQPIVDSDAITTTLNARQLNEIRELVPLDSLLLLTSANAWRTITGDDNPLTPSTVGFKPQSGKGASNMPALVIDDNSAVYVQDRGFAVRDIGYKFDTDGYTGSDLSVFSKHLIENKALIDWTYQCLPYSVIWIVRNDGMLLALTYMREQEIVAWTPMEMAGGTVESIACIPEGDEDVVYMVVNRTVNNVAGFRFVERMTNRLFTDVRECKFVDSCLTYDGRNTGSTTMDFGGLLVTVGDLFTLTASASTFQPGDVGDVIVAGYNEGRNIRARISVYTSPTVVSAILETPFGDFISPTTDWAFARDTISGLNHLDGESVMVLSDGFVHGPHTVTVGAITLTEPGALVHVGLAYTADLETLEPQPPGARNIRLDGKNIKRYGLLVENTRSIWYGPSFDKLDEKESRQYEQYIKPPDLENELEEVWATGSWAADGRMCVQQRDPLPAAFVGLLADFAVGQ